MARGGYERRSRSSGGSGGIGDGGDSGRGKWRWQVDRMTHLRLEYHEVSECRQVKPADGADRVQKLEHQLDLNLEREVRRHVRQSTRASKRSDLGERQPLPSG